MFFPVSIKPTAIGTKKPLVLTMFHITFRHTHWIAKKIGFKAVVTVMILSTNTFCGNKGCLRILFFYILCYNELLYISEELSDVQTKA